MHLSDIQQQSILSCRPQRKVGPGIVCCTLVGRGGHVSLHRAEVGGQPPPNGGRAGSGTALEPVLEEQFAHGTALQPPRKGQFAHGTTLEPVWKKYLPTVPPYNPYEKSICARYRLTTRMEKVFARTLYIFTVR